MSAPLLPCPFCGNSTIVHGHNRGGHYISCFVCDASTGLRYAMGDNSRPLLAEQWNRRAEGNAALRAIIKHWDEFGPESGLDELIDAARLSKISSPAGDTHG